MKTRFVHRIVVFPQITMTTGRDQPKQNNSDSTVPVSGHHWAAPPWWWARPCVLCTELSSAESPRCPRWRPLTSASSPIPRCRCAAAAGWDRAGTHREKQRQRTPQRLVFLALYLSAGKKASKQQDSLFRGLWTRGEEQQSSCLLVLSRPAAVGSRHRRLHTINWLVENSWCGSSLWLHVCVYTYAVGCGRALFSTRLNKRQIVWLSTFAALYPSLQMWSTSMCVAASKHTQIQGGDSNKHTPSCLLTFKQLCSGDNFPTIFHIADRDMAAGLKI